MTRPICKRCHRRSFTEMHGSLCQRCFDELGADLALWGLIGVAVLITLCQLVERGVL